MNDQLRERAKRLGLYGLLSRWETLGDQAWIRELIETEEAERAQRSLDRRIRHAKLGTFKAMADFDYLWPADLDRETLDELFTFSFLEEASNVVIVGPNGLGKTMIAQNLAYQALHQGMSVCFTTAAAMLTDLATQDGTLALARRLKRYCRPQLLVIDEVGYLSYDNRYADLLFEVVSQRYQQRRSILLTTNLAFQDWGAIFPNAACVVTLIDRLVHRSEVLQLVGKSYRNKEATDRLESRKNRRKGKGRQQPPPGE